MKNWLTQAVGFGTVAILGLTSCKKDEVQATLTPNNTPTLTASTNSVVLTQADAAQTAVTYTWTPLSGFTWNNADHPYNPAITYQLQVDKKGGAFTAPATINAGTSPTNVTVEQLNTALVSLGLPPGKAAEVDVRLNANYAPNAPQASPALSLTATPYKVCLAPTSDTWAIIGPAGVDWNTDVPLTYDCDTKTYNLTRDLNAGEFKFRSNGAWAVNYGSSSNDGGPLVSGCGNIKVAAAGTYTIKFDLANMSYTITK